MTDSEPLLIERDGGVLTLTNNDAPINRMTFEYMDALEVAVNEAASDPEVRVIVLTDLPAERRRLTIYLPVYPKPPVTTLYRSIGTSP